MMLHPMLPSGMWLAAAADLTAMYHATAPVAAGPTVSKTDEPIVGRASHKITTLAVLALLA